MRKSSLTNILLKRARALVRTNFSRIPDGLRANLERRLFQIHLDALPSDLTFKIAETREELEQAFRLLHDSYVHAGYMEKSPSGLRVTPYHAVPTTTTLIAKVGNKVVGTVSLIRQSSLELPVQSAFDLSSVVSSGDQVVEISSLAIDTSYRGQNIQLLFWLAKYVFDYCRNFFAIDFMFVTINPKQQDLYENIILFERLRAPRVENYDFANGAPAIAEYIDMSQYANRLMSVYWNAPAVRNVYAFIMHHRLSKQFRFPERAVNSVNDPVLTPELLNYFFNEKTSAFKEMDETQIAKLHEIYRDLPEYLAVLPETNVSTALQSRRRTRYQVMCAASYSMHGEGTLRNFEIIQVSDSGFLTRASHRMKSGDRILARVKISSIETIDLEAQVIWSDGHGLTGFALRRPTPDWMRFILHLRSTRNVVPDRRMKLRG